MTSLNTKVNLKSKMKNKFTCEIVLIISNKNLTYIQPTEQSLNMISNELHPKNSPCKGNPDNVFSTKKQVVSKDI